MRHAGAAKWVAMAAMIGAAIVVTVYFHRILGSAVIFTHLFYIPIILGALWWGGTGIVVAVLLVLLLMVSNWLHISPAAGLNDYFRATMFLVVSWTVVLLRGRIISSERLLKRQARDLENRVRALSCLYGLNNLREKSRLSLEEIVIETESLLKKALENDPALQVCLFREDSPKQRPPYPGIIAPIMVDGEPMGGIEVGWPEGHQLEAAAMNHIRELADSVAKRLGKIIEHENARLQVEQYRLHLEDLVQDRTEELIAVNRKLREEINERQKAEISLRESEKQYRTLFENAEEAIFIAQDNCIRFPNPALATLTGYNIDHLLQAPFADWIHPEDRNLVQQRYHKRTANQHPPSAYAFRIQTAAGEIRWVEINAVAIQWQGRPATLNFLRDITARKKMDTSIAQIRKMEAIGTLAGGIAHKFNNALSGISGNIDLLRITVAGNADVQRYSTAMMQSVQTMCDLTQQLLAYARGGKYQSQRYSLTTMVKDVMLQMAATGNQKIQFETVFSPDTPMVEADPVQMRMVLLAILQNAAEAIDEQGRIRIETFKARMDQIAAEAFDGLPPGDYASLSIVDNGKGMTPEVKDRLFEPFFTTKFYGRGLGMAAAYGIIKNHGGYIYVDSEPEHGTAVHILLPQCPPNGTGPVEPLPGSIDRAIWRKV